MWNFVLYIAPKVKKDTYQLGKRIGDPLGQWCYFLEEFHFVWPNEMLTTFPSFFLLHFLKFIFFFFFAKG
jgi:hypothetical protein